MVPRIVLDTNVLLSAFGWRGSPYEILRRTLQGEFRLLASPALLEELQRVLAYPKFGFSEVEIAHFLLTIAEGAEVVLAPARLSVVAQDPADPFLPTCVRH